MNDIKKNLPTAYAVLFLIVAVLSFYWAWSNSVAVSEIIDSGEDYTTVSVGENISRVKTILEGRQNIVGMPLTAPVENVGRTNPFAGL